MQRSVQRCIINAVRNPTLIVKCSSTNLGCLFTSTSTAFQAGSKEKESQRWSPPTAADNACEHQQLLFKEYIWRWYTLTAEEAPVCSQSLRNQDYLSPAMISLAATQAAPTVTLSAQIVKSKTRVDRQACTLDVELC